MSMVDFSKMQIHRNENLWQNRAEQAMHASWYLQKGWFKDFHFGDFSCSGGSFTQISHRQCRFILFVEIIIAMRSACRSFYKFPPCSPLLLPPYTQYIVSPKSHQLSNKNIFERAAANSKAKECILLDIPLPFSHRSRPSCPPKKNCVTFGFHKYTGWSFLFSHLCQSRYIFQKG